tara:strand:- start:1027 stop:1227 length:201 start_codon:yes stop_codon:yes gene_type:complete
MTIGDLVQYVDPVKGNQMPLVLLGTVLDMKVMKSMLVKVASVHAKVQWHNESQQTHWIPTEYLEVV